MTFETKMAAVFLLAATWSGCDRGSVGEYESDDGGTSSSGTEEGTEGGASAGPTGSTESSASNSSGSSSGSSVTAGETSGDSTGLPVGACEGNESHMCSNPVDCGDSCGGLDSMFDENGCVRLACNTHDGCGDGEFCYRPLDYGGCQSSDVSCFEDSEGLCNCASLPDCGGAYCVPEELVFGGAAPGPSDGWASDACAPDDGPAFVLRMGTYVSDACGGQFAEEPIVEFQVGESLGTTGVFVSEGPQYISAVFYPDGVTPQAAQWAVLYVTEAGDLLSGEYEITLADDTVLYGAFSAIACPQEFLPCG